MTRAQTDILQSLVNRLREARKEAGDRLGEVLLRHHCQAWGRAAVREPARLCAWEARL